MTRSTWALGLALLSLVAFAVAAVVNAVKGGPLDARVALIVAATAMGISALFQLVDRHRTRRASPGEERP
ncbi:hypothetical protein [Blastococcus aurantiacus]|uniref:hypothetical protein n=1 Tax=Blastococcus aurantiacus TaxID=1550231 RepID=UPI000B809031|nr:hypothetical protein [Blastococcus aurantiacus]